MPIQPGTRLGPYQIAGLLGAGGMGEVYRARDTRLARDVALKVLPAALASDAQRMARFHREAQLLAAVNHPHIAAIYGLEEAGESRALVMELVEGPTLAERISGGPLPLEEVLPIARQVAEALEYAHEHGIIHRDLKPANVKLTPEGAVKVLDFGLAKVLHDDASAADIANSPTLSVAATRAGLILGTAGYMSPEQAKGKPADRRADIWAFGVLLYELLTGQRAYAGETASEAIAHVITRDPAWQALPAATPERLRHLLRRCLTKDPRARLQAIGEVRIVIEDCIAHPGEAETAEVAPAPGRPAESRMRRTLPWAFAGMMALLAAAGLWGWWRASRPGSRQVVRFVQALPVGQVMPLGTFVPMQISPDGNQIVYAGSRGKEGGWGHYLRSLDQFQAVALGGEEGFNPFFSPDGQWVAYQSGAVLKKVSVRGGAPVRLATVSLIRGATWGRQGIIVVGSGLSALLAIPEGGGQPEPLTHVDAKKGESAHRWPHFLPDGRSLLFEVVAGAGTESGSIAILSLETRTWRKLIESGSSPRYVSSGHIVYSQGGTLFAVPFDLRSQTLTGPAVPVLDGVLSAPSITLANYSVSENGTLIYLPGSAVGQETNKIAVVDRRGVEKLLPAPARPFQLPRLSPDGQRMSSRMAEANVDVWVYDIPRGALSRLTFQPGEDETSAWTPDGKRIVYGSVTSAGIRALVIKNSDGSGAEEILWQGGDHTHLGAVSPDGRTLAFTDYGASARGDIWILPLEGERKPKVFLQTPFNEFDPRFSPDGRWLAYTSDESGTNEVYVQSFPGPGGKWQVSAGGGNSPVWAHNGRELFYRKDDKMMVVPITTRPQFSSASPKFLFAGQYLNNPRLEADYDVFPDGQRFLMLKGTAAGLGPTQYNVILNWGEELKHRAPPSPR